MFLILLACTSDPANPNDSDNVEDTGPTDADGDGVFTPDDCDDTREDVFPGADDPNGDGVDADCEGGDGVAYVACTPILVPDLYPTIEDALADRKLNVCLGPGTFTTAPLPDDTYAPTAIRGQGRELTFLEDPSGEYDVRVLSGLTATGKVSAAGSLAFSDVTFIDATLGGFDAVLADRCAFIRSPIEVDVYERIGAVALSDSWITGSDAGIVLRLSGCETSCSGLYSDMRMYGMTFTENEAAIALDIAGDYDIYSVIENSVFYDNGAVMTVEVPGGNAEVPRLYIDATGNVEWSEQGEAFPDGGDFSIKEQDPRLDLAFAPPRPTEDSPLIDSAKGDGTATDFWGVAREKADRGAVEW